VKPKAPTRPADDARQHAPSADRYLAVISITLLSPNPSQDEAQGCRLHFLKPHYEYALREACWIS
jgi:hypothetical protein